jgi:hypothetical protein
MQVLQQDTSECIPEVKTNSRPDNLVDSDQMFIPTDAEFLDDAKLWDHRQRARELLKSCQTQPICQTDTSKIENPILDNIIESSLKPDMHNVQSPPKRLYNTPLRNLSLRKREELLEQIYKEAQLNTDKYLCSPDKPEYQDTINKEADRLLDVWQKMNMIDA